ncbi:hypothetical protein [Bosea sp. 7B]|uniref:hypothetical protein n=1 Tax=Bosea sp. 7B TaxID=2768850 RepID=UPI00191BAB35|nr:hypothetical protein [Bosea sp. 7B]
MPVVDHRAGAAAAASAAAAAVMPPDAAEGLAIISISAGQPRSPGTAGEGLPSRQRPAVRNASPAVEADAALSATIAPAFAVLAAAAGPAMPRAGIARTLVMMRAATTPAAAASADIDVVAAGAGARSAADWLADAMPPARAAATQRLRFGSRLHHEGRDHDCACQNPGKRRGRAQRGTILPFGAEGRFHCDCRHGRATRAALHVGLQRGFRSLAVRWQRSGIGGAGLSVDLPYFRARTARQADFDQWTCRFDERWLKPDSS